MSIITRFFEVIYQIVWCPLPDCLVSFTRLFGVLYQIVWCPLPDFLESFTRFFGVLYQIFWRPLPDSLGSFRFLVVVLYKKIGGFYHFFWWSFVDHYHFFVCPYQITTDYLPDNVLFNSDSVGYKVIHSQFFTT